jgi:hypothetical protein
MHRAVRLPVGRFALLACVAFLLGALPPAPARAQASPQVTSEIACDEDDDCPDHGGLCFGNFLPGCGCDEGRGRCDPNPRDCDAQSDCFGQEVCSTEGRCVEPGGTRSGQLCNVDDDCRPWLRCIGGSCGTVECAVDGDCPEGLGCENTRCIASRCEDDRDCLIGELCRENPAAPGIRRCVAAQCVADDDCGDTAVCREGSCVGVECRSTAQCRGCELCDVTNRCVSRCEANQRCASFVAVEPGANRFFTIVSRCVAASSRSCTSVIECGRGERCLGGRCIRTPVLERDLDRFFRLPPERDPKPMPTPRPTPPP